VGFLLADVQRGAELDRTRSLARRDRTGDQCDDGRDHHANEDLPLHYAPPELSLSWFPAHPASFATLDVAFTGITISRCESGRIAEEWEITDVVGLLGQIGALPAMAQS